ncbi:MAG: adenosylcobinamide-GDP ribazoletransferase [Microcystaceae cyanobacterium]
MSNYKPINFLTNLLNSFLAAVIFYTTIPLPTLNSLDFTRIARWCPLIGILIGLCLIIVDQICTFLQIPLSLRSAILIAVWIKITGGLHLDGVIDTADGLAVLEKDRKLVVMKDSVVGAYGVIAAIILLLLKWSALNELTELRSIGLCLTTGWGRWGQVVAIAAYPYLKPTGKGAFHKRYLKVPQDISLGLFILICACFLLKKSVLISLTILGGSGIALLTGFWFARQLGGHTGDSYGAVVEWTEAIFLCFFVAIAN